MNLKCLALYWTIHSVFTSATNLDRKVIVGITSGYNYMCMYTWINREPQLPRLQTALRPRWLNSHPLCRTCFSKCQASSVVLVYMYMYVHHVLSQSVCFRKEKCQLHAPTWQPFSSSHSGTYMTFDHARIKRSPFLVQPKVTVFKWETSTGFVKGHIPMTKLWGLFLLWDPNMKREASLFCPKNSWTKNSAKSNI